MKSIGYNQKFDIFPDKKKIYKIFTTDLKFFCGFMLFLSTEMPQIFQVLRCYKCLTFQVHQTNKSNKFACKICNEKQSIKRHYGIGIAKDCRLHVQKLNKMRGEKDETKLEDVSDGYEEVNTSNSAEDKSYTTDNVKRTSKWWSYIDKPIEETDIDDNQFISETNHHKNIKRWPKNKKYQNFKAKKNFALKRRHCNDIDDNNLNIIENIHTNDDTKNVFSNRPLIENEDDFRVLIKHSKQTPYHDMKLPKYNSELKDNNLKDFTSINNTPKLKTVEVNKSSKWAQFIERDEDIGEENCYEAVEKFSKNIQPLFSLYNDSDIDDVLDI